MFAGLTLTVNLASRRTAPPRECDLACNPAAPKAGPTEIVG
jgi:hypothetical protein